MKARESKFSISRAPSSRARCRACKGVIEKGDLRIMTLAAVSSWPMPRRSVSLARHARCVTPGFAAVVLKVHGAVKKVPVVGELTVEELACARGVLEKATL